MIQYDTTDSIIELQNNGMICLSTFMVSQEVDTLYAFFEKILSIFTEIELVINVHQGICSHLQL